MSGRMSQVAEIPPGTYRGVVEGIESGHCTARIEVKIGPGGCRIVDYEATSDKHGLQHVEHGLLAEDALYVAFGEARGVTIFQRRSSGVYETAGGPHMQIRVTCDGGVLTWSWHWGTTSEGVVERSRATCSLTDY